MTYVIAEPCIDEKDEWTPFVRVNAIFSEGDAPVVAAALVEQCG
jgi:hypothetical protein